MYFGYKELIQCYYQLDLDESDADYIHVWRLV